LISPQSPHFITILYVEGNPVNYRDPSGKCITDPISFVVCAAIVVGAGFAIHNEVQQIQHYGYVKDWGSLAGAGLEGTALTAGIGLTVVSGAALLSPALEGVATFGTLLGEGAGLSTSLQLGAATAQGGLSYASLAGVGAGALAAYEANNIGTESNLDVAAVMHGDNSIIGKGGDYWVVSNEVSDPTMLQQINKDACVSACVEYLAREQGIALSQESAAAELGTPATFAPARGASVADKLNTLDSGSWTGFRYDLSDPNKWDYKFNQLVNQGTWGATMDTSSGLEHMVVVDGVENGMVTIHDPWGIDRSYVPTGQGSTYQMSLTEFKERWSWGALTVQK
jgi:hypothetical protein